MELPPTESIFIPVRVGRRVRSIELEEYLRGVVPCEMPHAFPEAALRAQAVAARTYALAELAASPRALSSGVADQVYRARAARPASDSAVAATRGLVLVRNGAVAPIRFHSDCGGRTANESDVFRPSDSPHLVSFSETFCEDGPHHRWQVRIPARRLASAARRLGLRGGLRGIEVLARDESGRADRIRLLGPRGAIVVRGNPFRLAVGATRLPSTLFELRRAGANYIFSGTGYGHGVGLCQWGARGRALAGQTTEEILAAYYPGTVVAPWPAR